jgi:hypothetical protein
MWFPSKIQWVVMWLALILACLLADNPFGEGVSWIGIIFVVIAAIFGVWMLEARRKKTN